MKIVENKTLDDLIRLTRKYDATGDVDLLDAKHNQTVLLSKQAFGDDMHWYELGNLVTSAVQLDKNITNQTIYTIYRLAGIGRSEPIIGEV